MRRCFSLRAPAQCWLALWLISFSVVSNGNGQISLSADIVETACAIDMDSRNQTVDMGVVPMTDILRGGVGPAKRFSINLVNCTLASSAAGLPDFSRFTMTFDAPASEDAGLFKLLGSAEGIGLAIEDVKGNRAIPGKAMPSLPILAGNSAVDFLMRLEGNKKRLKAGDYQAVVNFKLDYY